MSENSDDTPAQNKPADSDPASLAEETGEATRKPARHRNRQLLPGNRAHLKAKAIELLKGTPKRPAMTAKAVAKKLGINRNTVSRFAAEEGLGLLGNKGKTGVYVRPEGAKGRHQNEVPPSAKAKPATPGASPPKAPRARAEQDPLDPDVMVANQAREQERQQLAENRRREREAKRKQRGSTATDDDGRDRRPDDAEPFDPTDRSKDYVGSLVVPDSYDPLERIAQMSRAHWLSEPVQLSALRILAQLQAQAQQGRGKIDWDLVTVASIPEEHRHRLAGALLAWVDYAELPEAVRMAPRECRRVYQLIGLLPETVIAAEGVLKRWVEMRRELRGLVGGSMVASAEAREPMKPALAAETRYQAPRWGATAPAGPPEDDGLS